MLRKSQTKNLLLDKTVFLRVPSKDWQYRATGTLGAFKSVEVRIKLVTQIIKLHKYKIINSNNNGSSIILERWFTNLLRSAQFQPSM